MNLNTESEQTRPCWFVGASYGGTDDQTTRFLSEGIWENGYTDKHLELVRSMEPGDRIAIKAAYTRKHDLPFDARGNVVSVMAIKAVGIITENLNDGRRVKVDWTNVEPDREWYFFTHRGTVWKVSPGDWKADGLIAFAFEDKAQDIDRFCNTPFWSDRFGTAEPHEQYEDDEHEDLTEKASSQGNHAQVEVAAYTVDNILKDGCFLDRSEIEHALDRLRMKKNLILQGPPGTGKTWLAKRLAYALIGRNNDQQVRAVQFHPNLSYEDFVRGWRPTGDGKLSMADGVFMEAIKSAIHDPRSSYVVVIEEINRGNPAHIFGELLTLLEAEKRKPQDALELCYPDADGKRRPVHIPENLHVIGTMNVADRSLALVDLALRRRFAFINLEPKLGGAWREWVVTECGVDSAYVKEIERRIVELNETIAAEARLGKQFCIGHSYVTPSRRLEAGTTKKWFQEVVETEIGPLLEEYWFDAPDTARKTLDQLKQNWG